MKPIKNDFTSLPSVDKLLSNKTVQEYLSAYGKELTTYAVRRAINYFREGIQQEKEAPSFEAIVEKTGYFLRRSAQRNLREVINATGIIIHTNLGRAPYGEALLRDSFSILKKYSNLEFDLSTASRGHRNDHAAELLKYMTGAEEVLVVNNNAAAVMLVLRTFARGKEVIVSRGELIEIGGSFRIPEIMAASECTMVEVGTTNKTHLEDYSSAVRENTAILFKAHRSNYTIKGFTKEVELEDLVELGKKHEIPVLYDIGSGLLKKYNHPIFADEPNVKQSLDKGIDLICFSGDKLLGGPQAGIIAGKKKWIDKLKKEPMLRALRVCKTTLALLETACMYYLNDKELNTKNMIFKIFNREKSDLMKTAQQLKTMLAQYKIETEITDSIGQCGGGTLPDGEIKSYAVMISHQGSNKERSGYAEKIYHGLLAQPQPVLGVLKKGNVYFDVLTLFEEDIAPLAAIIHQVHQSVLTSSPS